MADGQRRHLSPLSRSNQRKFSGFADLARFRAGADHDAACLLQGGSVRLRTNVLEEASGAERA